MSEVRKTPSLGDCGVFKFIDGALIPSDQKLTVSSVNAATELDMLGVDLEANYIKSGLTGVKEDIENGELVFRLACEGDWWYCPERAFLSFPSVTSVDYQNFILGVDLGYLPTEEDFEVLKTEMIALIEDRLGVTPDSIKMAIKERTVSLSEVEHQKELKKRSNRVAVSETVHAKYQRMKKQLSDANKTIAYLEELLIGEK